MKKSVSLMVVGGGLALSASAHALPQTCASVAGPSGVYQIDPDQNGGSYSVYCDMDTDGGGWTLVASTQSTTLNDEASAYYNDLQTLAPAAAHTGVWSGLRDVDDRFDMRFTCRNSVQAANNAMTVDLSFYDVGWYGEITTGSDANSCFNEGNGAGQEQRPARRNNLNGDTRALNDQWNGGHLEGEDGCSDTGDFTVDFDDRGMDSNQSDGTDWGEDDTTKKCGTNGVASGQWFIFVRPLEFTPPNPDTDSDGVLDDADNCPNVANANQADGDVDGIGDACDACPNDDTNDADGDGVCQDVDNCPTIANGDQADDNGDGYGDACFSADADVADTVIFEGDAVVGPNAVIGGYTRVGHGAVINGSVGSSVSVGAGSTVGAGATVGDASRIGTGSAVGANCVIGSRVIIGTDVITGSNCVINDRATVGNSAALGNNVTVGRGADVGATTQIGDGALVGDNVILGSGGQVGGGANLGANSRVGDDFVFGANVAFEGNVVVGDNADFAADTVFGGYAVVGNNVTVGARSELASGASAASGVIIGTDTEIRGQLGANVVLGDNVFVGNQSVVSADATLDNNVSLGIFAAVGQRTSVGPDSAIYDGVVIGNDGIFGARNTILFRTSIGDRATINADTIIDEQITIGDDFTMGANSRLWPFSTIGDGVTVGANVLIRDTADINSGVTLEDGVLIYPETTIGQDTIIRAGVDLGVGNCSSAGCGNVSVGGCLDISADLDPFAVVLGGCNNGSSAERAGASCAALLELGVAASGTYWLDVDGAGALAPFQAYCDMTTDGGGWTMIGNGTWYNAVLNLVAPGQGSGQLSEAIIGALQAEGGELYRVGQGNTRMFIRDSGALFEPGLHYWRSTANDVTCSTDYAQVEADNMIDVGAGRLSCDPLGIGQHTCGVNSGWILIHVLDAYNLSNTHPCSLGAAYYPTGQALNTLWVR